jgi:hypothetical protein
MKTVVSKIVMVMASLLLLIGVSCSGTDTPAKPVAQAEKNAPAAQPEKAKVAETQEPQAPVSPVAAMPNTMEITGQVKQTDDGLVIAANMVDYHVLGRDLTDMVGKTVIATGTVEEAQGRYVINVMSVSETQK